MFNTQHRHGSQVNDSNRKEYLERNREYLFVQLCLECVEIKDPKPWAQPCCCFHPTIVINSTEAWLVEMELGKLL